TNFVRRAQNVPVESSALRYCFTELSLKPASASAVRAASLSSVCDLSTAQVAVLLSKSTFTCSTPGSCSSVSFTTGAHPSGHDMPGTLKETSWASAGSGAADVVSGASAEVASGAGVEVEDEQPTAATSSRQAARRDIMTPYHGDQQVR